MSLTYEELMKELGTPEPKPVVESHSPAFKVTVIHRTGVDEVVIKLLSELIDKVNALAESKAQVQVNIPAPIVQVNVPQPEIKFLPPAQVEVNLPPPEVSVKVETPPRIREIERDGDGNIIKIVEK